MTDDVDDDHFDHIEPVTARDDNNNSNNEANMNSGVSRKRIVLNRPMYTQKEFESEFGIKEKQSRASLKKKCIKCMRFIDPRNLIGIFTILNWVSEYNFKSNLIPDILSGLTVGVFHIPAALAYGALTSLNPVYGLYTSFYTGLTYVLFGTSKHLSVGTFAVTSLMVYSTITRVESEYFDSLENKYAANYHSNDTEDNANLTATLLHLGHDHAAVKLEIATGLAFWCGVVQITFSILKLGNISKYLSQPLLRAFTTGAACHVFTTQLKHVLGIYTMAKKKRILKLIYAYINLASNIALINWCAVIFSIIAVTFLVVMRIHVNERFKKQLRNIPIPIELIVIILGTLITHFAKLDVNFNLAVVGKIPSGLPAPALPGISLFFSLINDAVIISIVAFASSISVSDLYARKHKYTINANKELFALGMANVVGSFFKCFVSCGALARTAVVDSSGGRTQVVTVVASMVVLSVMLWFTTLLEYLPKACLGSIIVAALINLFKQAKDIPYYWKLDKLDFLTWVITFFCAVLLDIDFGIIIGIITVLFLNTYRSQRMTLSVIGQVKDYEVHSDVKRFVASEYESIKIIRPTQSIFYINCDFFRHELNTICPLRTAPADKTICEHCLSNYGCNACCKSKQFGSENTLNQTMHSELDTKTVNTTVSKSLLRKYIQKFYNVVIIDFSSVQFVDEAACKCLKEVVKEYKTDEVKIMFSNCDDGVLDFMKKMNCFYGLFDELIFLTVEDAIRSCA